MNIKEYTERDLQLAEEIGGLKTVVMSLNDKLSQVLSESSNNHRAMWARIDDHSKTLNLIKGIGFTLQVLWAGILVWIEMHRGGS